MTKPSTSTKPDQPAREVRERAAKGDTSNEGAQWNRDSTRKAVLRLKSKPPAGFSANYQDAYNDGWQSACAAVLAYLDGQTERASVRPGGLKSPRRGPGKGARRAS